jgi:hypothetical protein
VGSVAAGLLQRLCVVDISDEPVPACAAGVHRRRARAGRGQRGAAAGRLRAQFPPELASHSAIQEFYFGPDLLLARHDYRVDIAGGCSAIQYVSQLVEVDGILVPTRRQAYRCGEDGRPVADELMVSIDLSDVRLS